METTGKESGWRHAPPVRLVVAAAGLVARSFSFLRDLVARALLAAGFTPNLVTLAGPIVATPVAIVWCLGYQRLGGGLLIAAGAFDLLDGAVARIGGKATPFGAFFDSVIDRYSDFIVFTGILLYFLLHTPAGSHALYISLWVLSLLGTLLPSYIRARAETLIDQCKVGFMERAERTVAIITGALAGNLHLVLWLLAILGNLIAIERILYTREVLQPETHRWVRLIWRYERLSPPHAVLCAACFVFLIFGHHLIPRP